MPSLPDATDAPEPLPDALAGLTEAECVELDVRPILRAGGEPFSVIMTTAGEVPPGHALRLRAPFQPLPLVGVMRARGWRHWVERGEGDDWIVWFYRAAGAS